jgi:hypothetical protein
MKKIIQTFERNDDTRLELSVNLSDWHKQHPLADQGVDWEFQYMWATMTDEDAFAFLLKHPQWHYKFKDV